LDDIEGVENTIDDNFILMLNGGLPALELITQEETNQAKL
jgi:hypothetical protein